jgi:hypothetical protein
MGDWGVSEASALSAGLFADFDSLHFRDLCGALGCATLQSSDPRSTQKIFAGREDFRGQ